MAEARNVAALSFSLTHDGISVSYDQELLREIWHTFSRTYKKRIARFKNDFTAGIFPANFKSLGIVLLFVAIGHYFHRDITIYVKTFLYEYIFFYIFGHGLISSVLSIIVAGSLLWFALVQAFRLTLKWFLCYKGWLYENPFEGVPISKTTRVWFTILHTLAKSGPMLHSFQGALPHLPLPSLDETLKKHLLSIRPITTDEQYNELVDLTEKFRKGLGRRLQRYLYLKSLLTNNWVTDWWEEFVYLRQRSPIMINSNYYGLDTLNFTATNNQAARAANITWASLLFRRLIERQEITPFAIRPSSKVPYCTAQYMRLFNSCRIPGEEADRFRVWNDAKHIAVYCKGCWFKLPIHSGRRLLEPRELQLAFQEILDSNLQPALGEEKLAALTAGERIHWAVTRRKYFGNGINKTSLQAIERAAFVLILDEDKVGYDPDDTSKIDRWAENLLHGKAYDRWFDKSFNYIVSKNGRVGINAEHSWGDAAITAHFMEYVILNDFRQGYAPNGDCNGEATVLVHPERLSWALDEEVQNKIEESLTIARALIDDVEMALLVWTEYGKGFVKKLRISPDAFVQMALQMTYFKDQGKFSLTYEASVTRLFREGRTETVRSCTIESCDFARAMFDQSKTTQERLDLLRNAARKHQQLYKEAMCGKGIDRHLFGLYVIKRYLEEESPFFDKIFPPTYLLSTSQTPLDQCGSDAADLTKEQKLELVSAGGGFGPVSDEGYGVSYIFAGENQISFHISSKKSAKNTNSKRFREELKRTLSQLRALFIE